MNNIEIEIPRGKEVDWEESKKQNKIVLKDKQLTYEEICEKLFSKSDTYYYVNNHGNISAASSICNPYISNPNSASTDSQLEALLSLNKLINTAIYLNGDWKPYSSLKTVYSIVDNYGALRIYNYDIESPEISGRVIFKSEELAKQAIEILGIPLIKKALSTYY